MQALIDELLGRFAIGDAGLLALVDLTVLVAVADGRIDAVEMAALTEATEQLLHPRLDAAQVEHLVGESVAQIQALGPEASARDIGEVLAAHGAAEPGIRLAIAIALASEGLSAPELERIGEVAAAAGIESTRLDELISEAGAT